MISVSEAIRIITDTVATLDPVKMRLEEAGGYVLAEDVYSMYDIPAFPQSSMDGYALLFEDAQKNTSLKIVGESSAGSPSNDDNMPGNAVRIFTGAALPANTDTVVMQEKVILQNDAISINDEGMLLGQHVRKKGSEIKQGELALPKGTLLSPAAIGLLAAIGVRSISVYPFPSISIIITGNELQEPGNVLLPGEVYESNSFTLKTALRKIGILSVTINYADDNLSELTEVLRECLSKTDLVLLTGGVSVGDYDFVVEATIACGVEQVFHKIRQRPGKPLYFGKLNTKYVFGLPGNPSSVLTCFYQYVLLAIGKMCQQELALKKMQVPLVKKISKPASLTCFLKGFYDGESVVSLDAQESYRLHSFARANCLIRIEEGIAQSESNELVEINLLPE